VASRTRASATSSSPSTADILLEAAIAEIEARGVDGFRIDDVLSRAFASTSSLYHHYGSREQLLIAAEKALYERMADSEDRNNLAAGYAATTPDEFLAYLAGQLRRVVTDPANEVVRRERLSVTAGGLTRPDLAARIGDVQDQMFEAIAELFEWAKTKGLINPSLDTVAYCAWFHGMSIGHLVTRSSSVDTDRWLSVALPAALAPLRLPE
jgi:AcrR family transcriptional regulator